MVDKKTELDIKTMQNFLELWMKFHSLYSSTIAKDVITKDDEAKFFETKNMMRTKYDSLMESLECKYMPHGRLTDPVKDVLDVTTIRFISEKNLKKMDEDWKDSYVFLNNIYERLKNRKRKLEQFNPIGVFFKSVFNKR